MNTIETKSKKDGANSTVVDTSDELVTSADPLHVCGIPPSTISIVTVLSAARELDP